MRLQSLLVAVDGEQPGILKISRTPQEGEGLRPALFEVNWRNTLYQHGDYRRIPSTPGNLFEDSPDTEKQANKNQRRIGIDNAMKRLEFDEWDRENIRLSESNQENNS